MTITCPSCGQETPDGFPRCANCGAELGAERAPAREERKVVTVLFCDLVGFTGRAESMDPEDVRALLSGYHERVRSELERHGGTVEKFVGDAVMALFGAPTAHEDDPERAVLAALQIRDGLELTVRIGITTGEALVRLDAGAGEATATGDVVNTASRLQAAAPENGILVDETTFRATRRPIAYRDEEAVAAKGKAEPVRVWRALEARSRPGVDVEQRAATPLVGRRQELETLLGALVRAREAREPQLITLVGVPGIGKSRLVYELYQAVDADPELITWRQGRSLPYGEGVTYWAPAEMVKAQAGILETDAPEVAAEKLTRTVTELGADETEWILTHLERLLGLATGEGGPEDRQAEAFAAWRAFFEALAERHPTVLVFEDLQWADDGVLDFVDHLVEWSTGVPLLVVCIARPELLARRPGWGGGKPNAVTISLAPLSDEETARLVHDVLDRSVLVADVQSSLLARAGGNPLYAEEFARMVAEGGGVASGELPESVQGIIAARLDALSGEEKALLQDAAVVGKLFWAGAAAALGDRDRWPADETLHGLERREFIRRERRSSVAGETEYAFRHLLVQDVAYGQIPRGARAEKHRLAAEWIESLGRPADQAELLAHHYLRAIEFARAAGRDVAGLVGPALDALAAAGDRARALNAYAAARSFYGEAMRLAPADDPRRGVLLLRQAEMTFLLESEGADLLGEAFDQLLAAGDRGHAAEAASLLALLHWRRGERARASELHGRARRLVDGGPRSPAKASVLMAASRERLLGGDLDAALELAQEAFEIAHQLGLRGVETRALMTIGDAKFEAGDTGGIADSQRGLDLAGESSIVAITGRFSLADQWIEIGDLAAGFALREEAGRIAERLGVRFALDWMRGERPGELYTLGVWDEALRLADEFVAWSSAGAGHYLESTNRQVRGGILLARGELERAVADADAALELGRAAEDPQALYPALAFAARMYLVAGREAGRVLVDELLDEVSSSAKAPIGYVWLRSLAASLRALGRGDEFVTVTGPIGKRTPWLEAATALATGRFRDAADLYASLGAKPDEAYARLAGAEELVRAGRAGEAQTELRAALAFFRQVRATALIERAEALAA